ncbi:sigma-70 family RNA polymerase sigma factor [Baekduia alba]|uniref:sigma-70 family RNA polymerase sigma factor n=1 Tax=Baekduia alba TaxID=2997333 RepID=UPI002340B1F2|nr:sigma-70 family RNA polymerase sigma factor [Baekduia alba]
MRTDDQLVALFRAGHDEAFGTIHDRYRPRLFAYARQMLGGSQSDAEDVLQDVFLRAYNSLRADRRELALRAWLYRVAHNRCIDQLRRPAPAPEDIFDINRGVSTDLLDEAERREDLRRLIADVRALPEQQRSALLMREMEGLSYNDLAAALGVTVPAIKSLLVRARVGLVEAIEARDTACAEIRDDIASALDRGVRATGRTRRHLRECAGCREYRGALRGVEKSLNGLAFPSGPLTTVMKILGIGGAGSGAAAGGGAVAVGGGGAAGAASAGVATKVVAVVAAAAVVGGGAAKVEQRVASHPQHRGAIATQAHVKRVAVPAAAALPATQRRTELAPARHGLAPTQAAAAATEHGASRAPHVTKLREDVAGPIASAGTDAPKVETTTGGVVAPDDTAPDPTTGATTTDPGGSGTATAGDGTSSGAASTAPSGTAEAAPGTTPSSSTGSTSPATSTPSASATPGSSPPAGTVSQTPTAPMAQGASATPPPAG